MLRRSVMLQVFLLCEPKMIAIDHNCIIHIEKSSEMNLHDVISDFMSLQS